MSKNNQRLDDPNALGHAGQHMVSRRKVSSFRRALRMLSAVLVCGIILFMGLAGSLYFVLQGKSDEGSTLLARIEASIEGVLGPKFDVTIESGTTDLSRFGRLSFIAQNVVVKDLENDQIAGTIGNVDLDANWIGYISGEGAFEHIEVADVSIQAPMLFGGDVRGIPPHLDIAISGFGRFLSEISTAFKENELKTLDLSGIKFEGAMLGRLSSSPVIIPRLSFQKDGNNNIRSAGDILTDKSKIRTTSVYQEFENQASTYEFEFTGVNLEEWSVDPRGDEGFVAVDGLASVSGSLRFDETGKAQDPSFKIAVEKGNLRLGKNERSEISSLDMNFKIFLDKNQIELERSYASIGGFSSSILGGLKPVNASDGYAGSLLYDFIIEHGEYADKNSLEAPEPGAFQAAGVFDPSRKLLNLNKLIFTTKMGAVTGSASIGLDGETPSVRGQLTTERIQVRALKQFWPFFVAANARKWVLDHIHDGWVEEGSVIADIPAGILFRLKDGQKLEPKHYRTQFKVRDFSFRPFGEMPKIEQATGNVVLEGMKIEARIDSGIAKDGKGKEVKIREAGFVMSNFADKNRTGETNLKLDGDIEAIARISNRKPLRVMERMKVAAKQFSGQGHADVVAVFPVGRKISYQEVDWNVLLQLEDGSSSKKLEGRQFSKADLLIDASPTGAKVSGTAAIDGVKSRIEIVQPIGKSGKVKPMRKIVATLDENDREKLGFDLRPVIEGPVAVNIVRSRGKEKHTINFTDAKVSLPWIGWSKGSGIVADGKFDLVQSKDRYILKNFSLKGAGFESHGELVLNKKGLMSAEFSSIKLNQGDDIRLKIKREGDTYNINATGLSYDVRSILNTLVHSGGFSKAQGGRSVNLVANFDKIRGFNNRIMRNAILLYESRNGQLTRLDMSATGSDGRRYSAKAQLNGNETLFTMSTNDAGNALAFADIYTRMQGGSMTASLVQSQDGPFLGPVKVSQFKLVNEPRLANLTSNVRAQIPSERGQQREILPDAGDKKISFQLATADIERGKGYLNINDAVIRSGTMGFTASGILYDKNDRINLNGTFMPANGVNLAVSAIPILGDLLSNGRDNALIGITYKLSGQRKNPKLQVNPLSIVTPGVFNKVFEFR